MTRRRLFGKSGATLIELIVTIVVIAIISGASAGIIVSLTQLFVYLPREVKTRSIAHEVTEIIIEGEAQKRGMRYAVGVQDALPTQFAYTFGYPANTNKRIMMFRWDSAQNKLFRSYTAFGADLGTPPQPIYISEETIPYYATAEISIKGKPSSPNTIFSYFKADGSPWSQGTDPLTAIRRVEINMVVSTGTGAFTAGEGSFQTTSSVEIRQYI